MSHEEQSKTEDHSQYGELFYSSSSVVALLRTVAELLEAGQRRALLQLSADIPTTMSWDAARAHSQQPAGYNVVCVPVHVGLQHHTLFGLDSVGLTALVCSGPAAVRALNWEHDTGMVNWNSYDKRGG